MNSLRVLITGITSIHGWPIFERFRNQLSPDNVFGIRSPKMKVPQGRNVVALCITDKDQLCAVKKEFKPTHVVHCAGVCDLDVCEEREQWAFQLNTVGSRIVAEIFNDCHITYLSSDLVFSGNNPPPGGYKEDLHVPDPVSVAGKTIAAAEMEIDNCSSHCIVRLGLPIGQSVKGDKGAVDFIEGRLRRSLPITLFVDELRSCVDCDEIARGIMELTHQNAEGLFHFGGPIPISLHDIGRWILKRGNYNDNVLKGILRKEEKNGPPRIGNVALDSSKISSLLSFQIKAPIQFNHES